MTTDTTPQAIQEHLDYAAEVLPEIAEALRLLRGNATVLSEIDRLVMIKSLNDAAMIADGFDEETAYARDCRSLLRSLKAATTRVILVREEPDDGA